MLAEAMGGPRSRPHRSGAGDASTALQLGAVLAVLGTRILGQYLPFGHAAAGCCWWRRTW